eukprot:6373258-Prymnesium_polylepis.1
MLPLRLSLLYPSQTGVAQLRSEVARAVVALEEEDGQQRQFRLCLARAPRADAKLTCGKRKEATNERKG